MKNKVVKRIAVLLVLSLVLAGITPVTQAEAASIYKKFPTYTRYENKFGKSGMTANAGALEQLLAAKSYVYVYLRNTATAETYTIPANSKFAGKRLRVNAPLSKVVNHAAMKVVKITALGNDGWTEYGKGNSFAVVDPDVKMEVGTGATVDKLYFQAENGKVDLKINGDVTKTGFYGDKMDASVTISEGTTKEFRVASKDGKVDVTMEKTSEVNTVKIVKDADVTLNVNDGVEKVVLDAPANVTITGDSEKVKEVAVEVNEKAEGAAVTSDVPVKAEVAAAKTEITLKEGAEGSTVQKANENVDPGVKNETKENVTVSTEGKTETETVPSENKDTTGGGSTGGGSTGGTGSTGGGGTSSGGNSGNQGGGTETPPVVTPTVTPSAITTILVTADNITGGALTFTQSAAKEDTSYSGNLTVTGSSAKVIITLGPSGVAATATKGGSPVNLNNITCNAGDIITIVITDTASGFKTTLEISVTLEGNDPPEKVTTNIKGFTVTATNITGDAVTSKPTDAGENGKYTANATVSVTDAATTVTVTVDIPNAASVSSITGATAGTLNGEKAFTVEVSGATTEGLDKTITITETNGAETTLTITVKRVEETPVSPGNPDEGDDDTKTPLITAIAAETRQGNTTAEQPKLDNDGRYTVAYTYNSENKTLTVTATGISALEADKSENTDESKPPVKGHKYVGIAIKLTGTATTGAIKYSADKASVSTAEPIGAEAGVENADTTFIFYPDVTAAEENSENVTVTRYLQDANGNVYTINVTFIPFGSTKTD